MGAIGQWKPELRCTLAELQPALCRTLVHLDPTARKTRMHCADHLGSPGAKSRGEPPSMHTVNGSKYLFHCGVNYVVSDMNKSRRRMARSPKSGTGSWDDA